MLSNGIGEHELSPWKCERDFESFSIYWCRSDILSMLHLLSLSFWTRQIMLLTTILVTFILR